MSEEGEDCGSSVVKAEGSVVVPDGTVVVARSSNSVRYPNRWLAQNDAEQLARSHISFGYDQERRCWHGSDRDGRTYRYAADRATPQLH